MVTIYNDNYEYDLGYVGFSRLRLKVAELTTADIYEHYKKLDEGRFLVGEKRKRFFKEYNAKIQKLDEKYNGKYANILNFLYSSGCSGEMDIKHCKSIYKIIKDYDDDICYGYSGHPDCMKFRDFKQLVKDSIDTNTSMKWR